MSPLTPLHDAMQTRDLGEPLSDQQRELLITHHAACMKASAAFSSERSRHWILMRDLINGRSETAVVAMETARGLR